MAKIVQLLVDSHAARTDLVPTIIEARHTHDNLSTLGTGGLVGTVTLSLPTHQGAPTHQEKDRKTTLASLANRGREKACWDRRRS